MSDKTTYFRAIEANLNALRVILTRVICDLESGLEAAGQGSQNGAIGSIIPVDDLLKQASILIQAILILHRQS